MTLQHQKHLFDIPEDVTYLNIAAQSPSTKATTAAGKEGLKQKSQPHTILGSDYFEPVEQLRKLFAEVIDCDEYERVATSPSVSYGLANMANNITLNKGDEILVLESQFPSNVYIWQILADKYDGKLVTVKTPETDKDNVLQWNKNILEAINDKTAVVAMGNIHWSNGALFDLKAIRNKTKQHNALLIIDGSQSIGALPFSVNDLLPDGVVCAGYKWLFGPYGCAYAYYGPFFDNGTPIEENWSNRLNSENFAGLTSYQPEYKSKANRYMMGESGNFIYVKMQIAALKQVLQWNPSDIQDYCLTISSGAIKELQQMGCQIENPNQRGHHLFGVKIPDSMDLNLLKSVLSEHEVFVSFRGQYIRVSCHYFNTKDDFKALVNCMTSVLQIA